jgi:hypothetical protein
MLHKVLNCFLHVMCIKKHRKSICWDTKKLIKNQGVLRQS